MQGGLIKHDLLFLIKFVGRHSDDLGDNFIPEHYTVGCDTIGRGGPLGDCDGSAVAAAFGYFNPAIISRAWDSAKAKVAPRVAGRAHLGCSANFGRAKLAEIPHLAEFVIAADAANEAADPDGLALYAAIKVEPLAADTAGRAALLVGAQAIKTALSA